MRESVCSVFLEYLSAVYMACTTDDIVALTNFGGH